MMINESMKLIATELANNGIVLDGKQNSIFNIGTYEDNENTIVNSISTLVGNTVSLFKNKYVPAALSYKEQVNVILQNKLGSLEIKANDVVKISINEVVTELINRDIVGGEGSYVELPISTLSIRVPEEEIRSYFKSDLPVLQKHIDNLLATVEDDYLIKLWEKYLLNVSGSNIAISTIRSYSPTNLDELALLFVLVDNIRVNIPEYVRVKESVYTNIMNSFKDKLQNDLMYVYKEIKYYESVNRLIIKITHDDIYVIKSTYNKFIKDNSVEALLGFAKSKDVDDVSNYTLDGIVINSSKYQAVWNNYIKLEKLAIDEVSIYRLAYIMAVEEVYVNTDDEVTKVLRYENSTLAQNAIKEYLFELDLAALRNISLTAKNIFSRVILDNGNFSMYVDNMYNYIASVENVTPKEAASLATLDLVLGYLLVQVDKK